MTPSSPLLRVALLGCGRIARQFHLPLLARMPGVALRVVADPDPAAREAGRGVAPNAAACSDWEEATLRPEIDAVVISLPTPLHAQAAGAAFAAGRHVYLEKPIATSPAESEGVVEAWRASGRVGMMGFNARFDPTVTALQRALAEGRAGQVIGVRIAFGGASGELPGWKRSRASGGGAILELGSHVVDLARLLLEQEVESVVAALSSRRTEDDTASLVLTMAGGALVQAFVSLGGVQESVIEVVGDRGVLVADRYAGTVVVRPPRPPYGRLEHLRRVVALAGDAARGSRGIVRSFDADISYRAALTAFVGAVSGGPFAGADIEEGHCNLMVLLAAEASARRRSPVSLAVEA